MRSIIKIAIPLIIAIAIYLCSGGAHQEPPSEPLSEVKLKYDAIMAIKLQYDAVTAVTLKYYPIIAEYIKHGYETAEPHPKGLLKQMEVVKKQTVDLMGELGCPKEENSIPCMLLKAQEVSLEEKLLVAEQQWSEFEKEQKAAAGKKVGWW